MTHNINAEKVKITIERGKLIKLLLMLDDRQFSLQTLAKEPDTPEGHAQELLHLAKRYEEMHDELKAQLVKHDDAAKLKGWRV